MRASILSASQSLLCAGNEGRRGLLFPFQSARYVNLGFKDRLKKATNRKKRGKSVTRSTPPAPAEYSRIFSCCANLGIFAEIITKVSPGPRRGGMGKRWCACAHLRRRACRDLAPPPFSSSSTEVVDGAADGEAGNARTRAATRGGWRRCVRPTCRRFPRSPTRSAPTATTDAALRSWACAPQVVTSPDPAQRSQGLSSVTRIQSRLPLASQARTRTPPTTPPRARIALRVCLIHQPPQELVARR